MSLHVYNWVELDIEPDRVADALETRERPGAERHVDMLVWADELLMKTNAETPSYDTSIDEPSRHLHD